MQSTLFDGLSRKNYMPERLSTEKFLVRKTAVYSNFDSFRKNIEKS